VDIFPIIIIDPATRSARKAVIRGGDVESAARDLLGLTALPYDEAGVKRIVETYELDGDLVMLSECGDIDDDIPLVSGWKYGPTQQRFIEKAIILRMKDGKFLPAPMGAEADRLLANIAFEDAQSEPLMVG
jgi:hypothetical protein